MQGDIDLMRDVYMTRTQREAYERILALAEGAEADRADARRYARHPLLRRHAAESVAKSGSGAILVSAAAVHDLFADLDAALAGAVTQGEEKREFCECGQEKEGGECPSDRLQRERKAGHG